MGFVKSMVSNSRGAGWNAQQDPNAVNNLQNQYGMVQSVEGQLQGVANGTGPNPALAQLQQTTDQNIAQNAGFVASQKGINPALAARLAGQNAGQMNQAAAGQAAVQTANQQLGALGQLGSLAGNTQSNIQAGLNSANSANAGIAQQNAAGQYGLINGVGGAIGVLKAHGGMIPEVHNYADGGPVSALGQFYAGNNGLNGNANAYISAPSAPLAIPNSKHNAPSANGNPAGADPTGLIGGNAIGGLGGADLSAASAGPMIANRGALVPGRASVGGDNFKNDTVPAVLSPGEIVIPRSITQGKDAPKRAAEFVAKVLAKNGLKKK